MPSFFNQKFKSDDCSFYTKEHTLEKQSKSNFHIDNQNKKKLMSLVSVIFA